MKLENNLPRKMRKTLFTQLELIQQEQGENLFFRRVLLKLETKTIKEPKQKKKVFKISAKFSISVVIWS